MSTDPIIDAAVATFAKVMKDSEDRGFIRGFGASQARLAPKLKALIDGLQSEYAKLQAGVVDDALESLISHADVLIDDPLQSANERPPPPMVTVGRAPRSGSDQDKVLRSVHENPGLKSIDFVRFLSGIVNERTVRTALHRLKVRGLIGKRGDGWYSAGEIKRIEGQTAATG